MNKTRTGLGVLAVLAAVVLSLVSWSAQREIRTEERRNIAESLISVRDTAYHSILAWTRDHESSVTAWSSRRLVQGAANELLATPAERDALLGSPAQRRMREWFPAVRDAMGYNGYFIVSPDGTNLASSRDENVGSENLLLGAGDFLDRIWSGQSAMSLPVVSDVPLADADSVLRAGLPTMFAGAPIVSESGEVIAAFMFRLRPDEGFTGILRQGRIGLTGETYAFDGSGRLISGSRYDEQLRQVGLIGQDQNAILNLRLLDPGANLIAGESGALPRDELALTRMALSALSGQSSVDVGGYRDYRGVTVLGAWLWDPRLGLGIASEIDADEAYGALRVTTRTINALTVVAVLLVVGLSVISLLYRQRRLAEIALRERETLFSNLVHGVATDYLIVRQSPAGAILYASPAMERFAGLPAYRAIGRKWWDLLDVSQPELERIHRNHANTAEGQSPEPFEFTYGHVDGGERTVEVLSRPEYDDNALPVAVLSIIKDVTDRHRTEQELRRAATVFENTDEGIIVTDADRNIIAVNGAFTRISGYAASEVLGKNPRLHASGRHDRQFFVDMWRSLKRDGEWRGEIWNRRKNGEVYPAWENITVVRDESGQVVNYVALFSDISAIKETEERLAYLAHHDPLTGLANRLRFTANLEQALEAAKRHRQRLALLYLDLDGFKPINDELGHEVGDELLKIVADRMEGCVRAEDTVARLGGDEFAVILTEIGLPEDAAAVARKIIAAVGQPLSFAEHDVAVAISVGVALYPDDSLLPQGLLRVADEAMYHAKERGCGYFEYHRRFDSSEAEAGPRIASYRG